MRIRGITRIGIAAVITLCGAPLATAAPAANGPGLEPETRSGSVWDRLAHCESGGDWATNSGNGYYGGLQFDRRTWSAYGGGAFAGLPHQASRDQQISVASSLREDRGGYGAWPSCARKLGLPR
ncbi:hypothetical protein GCM10027271_17090 [Saccharopolyspora gloriosae]|uniref:Resuscitation-promoting factor core lysozyme-like domain-containing protein n=1 Tax=Saccharopolyspora gloriosae TaxID=455344 RepID=A0A840ND46_9PSEU|nr:hypothetical protein [Saccharopolyspora gloriosae]